MKWKMKIILILLSINAGCVMTIRNETKDYDRKIMDNNTACIMLELRQKGEKND